MVERLVPGSYACGEKVTRIENSARPTMYRDGTRFVYPDAADLGWCEFRCRKCRAVIDETFRPTPEADRG